MTFKTPSIEDISVGGLAFIISSLVGLMIYSLIFDAVSAKEERMKEGPATVETSPYVKTVKHDNHLFVLYAGNNIIHHPSCPCLSGTTKVETNP